MKRLLSFVLLILLCPLAAFAQVGLGENTSTFGRTIHVHATGSPAENGAALTAAFTSDIITGRSDPMSEPVVIQLGTGLFEIDSIDMPDYVAVRGAGIDATTIKDTASPISNYILGSIGTTNWFSHFTVSGSGVPYTIGTLGGDIRIDRIRSQSPSGVISQSTSGNAMVTISNSELDSTENAALVLFFGGSAMVEHSTIDGVSSSGDGIVVSIGEDNALDVSYSFIGQAGVQNPFLGTANCAWITTGPPLVETLGCPEPPPAPAGTVQYPSSAGLGFEGLNR